MAVYVLRNLLRLIQLCSVIYISFNQSAAEANQADVFDLLMPNVVPPKPETYFCTPIRIDSETDYYIVGFVPNATMNTAHHMLVYGCEEPGTEEEVWNCGEMAIRDPSKKTAPVCKKGAQVIYAWAHHAPPLQLPKDVGFHVGGKSKIKYLVLQVHYAEVERYKDGVTTDDSGVFLHYTTVPQPKTAGVLLMVTGGRIKANSIEHMDTACELEENKVIHPFAFRTHTHALGRLVSGYKVVRRSGLDEWTLIGKRDPQLPQMFYPVANNMTLTKGDTVAARCVMVSNRDRVTRIGLTSEDEMCNFYLMYWTEGVQGLSQKTCYTAGPPLYQWSSRQKLGLFRGMNNIPEEASKIL